MVLLEFTASNMDMSNKIESGMGNGRNLRLIFGTMVKEDLADRGPTLAVLEEPTREQAFEVSAAGGLENTYNL